MKKNLKSFKRSPRSKRTQRPAWRRAYDEVVRELAPKNYIDLPFRAITREQARNEELRTARRQRTDRGTSFRELFKARIDNRHLTYRKAVITGTYTIEYTEDSGTHREGAQERRDLSYLGPVPYGLETNDLYKYVLYKIFDDHNGYWKVIAINNARINYVSDISMREIRMRGIKLKNMILDQLNNMEIKERPGHCVLDYIWTVCNGKKDLRDFQKRH